jgi:hypothetical protein
VGRRRSQRLGRSRDVDEYLARRGKSPADGSGAPELDPQLRSKLELYQSAHVEQLVRTLRGELAELLVGRTELDDVRRLYEDDDGAHATSQQRDTITYLNVHRDAALEGCAMLLATIRKELGTSRRRWFRR